MKKNTLIGLGVAAVALTLGTIQASAQASVLFDFSDGTSQGWSSTGFSSAPAANVTPIGANNYISLPLGSFQVGNVASDFVAGAPAANFDAAMYAAINNPAGSYLQYDYYIDTSTFTTAGSYLQLGTFVNTGSGWYAQDFGAVKEVELDGVQVASGNVFYGTVTVPFSAFGTDPNGAASETYFRLGLIENGDGTGVNVEFTNIKVVGVPEPATLAMCGMGLLGGLLALRRRNR